MIFLIPYPKHQAFLWAQPGVESKHAGLEGSDGDEVGCTVLVPQAKHCQFPDTQHRREGLMQSIWGGGHRICIFLKAS